MEDYIDLIKLFDLKNNLTDNSNIWVGHASVGVKGKPDIREAKDILGEYFEKRVDEYVSTPEELLKTFSFLGNSHPFQNVREIDQPLFFNFRNGVVYIAVIWPWHIKKGVASLMLYKVEFG